MRRIACINMILPNNDPVSCQLVRETVSDILQKNITVLTPKLQQHRDLLESSYFWSKTHWAGDSQSSKPLWSNCQIWAECRNVWNYRGSNWEEQRALSAGAEIMSVLMCTVKGKNILCGYDDNIRHCLLNYRTYWCSQVYIYRLVCMCVYIQYAHFQVRTATNKFQAQQ